MPALDEPRGRSAAPGDILQVIADSRVDMEGCMRGILGFLFYSSITLAPVLIAVSVAGQFFIATASSGSRAWRS